MRFRETVIERDDIPKEWINELGGKYTFWENLKMGGTGSPPLQFLNTNWTPLYKAGLQNSSESIPFIFQRLKHGLVFRANWRTKTYWGGVAFHDISGIVEETLPDNRYKYSLLFQNYRVSFTLRPDRVASWKRFVFACNLAITSYKSRKAS